MFFKIQLLVRVITSASLRITTSVSRTRKLSTSPGGMRGIYEYNRLFCSFVLRGLALFLCSVKRIKSDTQEYIWASNLSEIGYLTSNLLIMSFLY